MSDFLGKAALVTGAGSGIGRATSLALAAEGAFVWVTDFNKDSADETAGLIVQNGGQSTAIRLDVSQEAEWLAAFERVDARPEGLSTLVNCAGKSMFADTFTMALEDLRQILAINVDGTFLGMKYGIPRIAESGGGAVVNISSVAGLSGRPRMAAYCAAKGAVRMMSKAVALECATLKNLVRVNTVHPGIVDTAAWTRHAPSEVGSTNSSMLSASGVLDAHAAAKNRVPIGVACTPEEVAATVLFLATDGARHITGSEVVIDGGMTAGRT